MTAALAPIWLGQTVRSRSVRAHERLDAAYFSDDFVQSKESLALIEAAGTLVAPLGQIARVWDPPRFARAWAAPSEDGIPYLRPYDVFDYLPEATQRLSAKRNKGIDDLRLAPGTILQTCSGRNLGPNTIVDEDLAGFCLSHDMVRIEIDDELIRLYVLAYLKSKLGQSLIRRNRRGSVIDHMTADDVSALVVPLISTPEMKTVADLMGQSVELRANARRSLRVALGSVQDAPSRRERWIAWPEQAKDLIDRLDAAYYEPSVKQARLDAISGDGPKIGDLCDAVLPVRYKRYYVQGDMGRPIVSGRQLLQPEPINLRRVSDRSFKNPEDYELRAGMTVFGAVGRAEGRQAWPALVGVDRADWLASNDVMRLIPKTGCRPGAVWLGVAAHRTQVQIKALSFGSVVDHMNPWDVEEIILPPVSDSLAIQVETAWSDYADSVAKASDAVALVDNALAAIA